MKKFNLKKLDWKDPKVFFPIVFVIPILFMGWMGFGIAEDLSTSPETDSLPINEISGVPLGDSVAIQSKEEAFLEAFKDAQDYTAISLANESTRIVADTTLYTDEELLAIASQEQAQTANLRNITESNQRIQEQNARLAASRREIGQESILSDEQGSSSALDQEILMYQKILRGEEILTPDQELERKLNQARQDERAKVLSEMNHRETSTVEKVSAIEKSSVFNTVSHTQEDNSYIRAMVDQGVSVTTGSRIRFRLLDDIKIDNITVPAGTHIYGIVTDFGEQRVKTSIESIITKGKRVKVNLSVYDRDGIEGFFIPKSSFRDFTKDAGSQAIGQGNINFNSTSAQSLEGVALQTIQGVYQSASNALSNKVRENKAKIKYNTTIYLINNG